MLAQSISETDGNRFGKYYDTFMQSCTDILSKTLTNPSNAGVFTNPEAALVRGKAMECIGNIMIGMCIKENGDWIRNDKCIADSHKLMKVLLPYLANEREAGLESYSFMNYLFASIAICIRSEFQPYLRAVITPLIEACKLQPVRIEHVSTNNENINNMNNNSNNIIAQTFHVHGEMADRKVELNTSEAMEQQSAVQQLYRYAENLGTDLFEFVEPICTGLLPIMKRKGNGEISRIGVKTMPYLVEIMKNGLKMNNKSLNPVLSQMLNMVISGVISAMVIEDEVNGLTEMTEDLIELLNFVDLSNENVNDRVELTQEIVAEIVEQIGTAIQERSMRRGILEDAENSELTTSNSNTETNSTSEVNDREVEQSEADLSERLCDLVSKMMQLFGASFVSMFEGDTCKATRELFAKKNE